MHRYGWDLITDCISSELKEKKMDKEHQNYALITHLQFLAAEKREKYKTISKNEKKSFLWTHEYQDTPLLIYTIYSISFRNQKQNQQ